MKDSIMSILLIFSSCILIPLSIEGQNRGYDFGYGVELYENTPVFYYDVFSYNRLCDILLVTNSLTLSSFPKDTVLVNDKLRLYCGQDEINRSYYFSLSPKTFKEGMITLKDKTYPIDSLYSLNNKLGGEFNSIIISSVYTFSFNSVEYLLLYLMPIVTNSYTVPYKGILVKLNSDENEIIILPGYQYSNSSYCINDFNKDGTLDYAYIHDMKVYLYSFSTSMEKDKEYYLQLTDMPSEYGLLKGIDEQNSKWFYPFNK